MPATLLRRTAHRRRGFTLIELMIVVGVIGVLAAIALPSFLDSVRKGRRADAVAALAQVQQAQERWRANNSTYADDGKLTTAPPNGLGLTASTPGGYYTIRIDDANGAGYTLTAQAVSGTSQAADANCSTMRVRMAGGNIQYGGCAGCDLTDPLTDPNRCWAR
jgi:type IV pilus assembly protein PilE